MKGPMRFRSPARGSEPEEHKTGHRGSKGHFQGETRNSSFDLNQTSSRGPARGRETQRAESRTTDRKEEVYQRSRLKAQILGKPRNRAKRAFAARQLGPSAYTYKYRWPYA